ncbi:hypothetical protein SCHPADRAFT_592419 [Schizopora paradoxa]|uniref:MYND-type domain-containing protein n=1 Tax=Schizopora paradoxa TaxID=27342 RepID=A0A0H2RAJ0_9AGAM|nr:hypothetical protein SCHPADRAFT_592419 [Schizopora paradoxa]
MRLITSSIFGLSLLGCKYFNLDTIHRHRFKLCWPNILKWVEAIIEGDYYQGDEELYFNVTPILFRTMWTIRKECFDEDRLFRFAIRLWIGHRTEDKTDYYSAQPLIACMQRKIMNKETARAEELFHACGTCADRLTDRIIARLKHATYGSSSIDINRVSILIDMLGHLTALTERTLLAVASRKVARVLVDIMTEIVYSPVLLMGHITVVRSTLRIFRTFLLGRTLNYALTLMESGILNLLIKAASSGFDDLSDKQNSMWTDEAVNGCSESKVLWELILCLSYRDMVATSRLGLLKLSQDRVDVEEYLYTSSDEFRTAWKSFETAVLEQTVLVSLFKVDYAVECGACSNKTCWLLTARKDHKKCGGCSTALYCSATCQREDWPSHRNICKKMEGKS